jgi:spore germination protein GerM
VASGVRAVTIAVVGALVTLAVACSPGSQDQPDAIDRRDVPFELLDSTTTSTTPASLPTESDATVYFVVDGALVPVGRDVAPTDVDAALQALLEGPTTAEAALGVASAIPSGTTITRLARDGETLTVDLETDPGTAESDAPLAVGQLVLTVTTIPGVERVRFRVGGEPVQVPKGDGTLSSGAVSADDYQALVRR